jgi:NTP pyrophosphatase (non-canonical NTP hydrolase)
MKLNEYQELSKRTHKEEEQPHEALLHAQLGIASEAGELADAIKKEYAYEQSLDKENVEEELGDLLWYISLACCSIG